MITWDALKELGFVPDPGVHSDISPGLSLDFGNFKLEASAVMNRHFAEVIMFTGALLTPRTMSEIDFEMPRAIDSTELCAAWIVWHLDQSADGEFRSERPVAWLALGRANQDLLPWIAKRAARDAEVAEYELRPRCLVKREWARQVLKDLRAASAGVDPDTEIIFSFDGEALKIHCADKVIAAAGTGRKWPATYSLRAKSLRRLPTRLMDREISFSIWKNDFHLANWCYRGVITRGLDEAGAGK